MNDQQAQRLLAKISEAIVETVAEAPNGAPCGPLPVTPNDEHYIKWHAIWSNALAKMPRNKQGRGHWGALCFALGWPLYSSGGSYNGHSRVYGNWRNGWAPRDANVRHKLLKIADPRTTKAEIQQAISNARYFKTGVVI